MLALFVKRVERPVANQFKFFFLRVLSVYESKLFTNDLTSEAVEVCG